MKKSKNLRGVFIMLLIMLFISCESDETTQLIEEAALANLIIAPITNLAGDYAISGGEILDDGGANITRRGVCYSTSPTPTVEDSILENGSGTGTFESIMDQLNFNTTYYIRAYAENSQGVSYSNELTFSTNNVCTQNIFEGDVTLTTQTEVDEFGALGYCGISGSLKLINDENTTNFITDLSPLNNLREVPFISLQGLIALASLNGLENLSSIRFGIDISKCHELVNLDGLSGITNEIAFIGIQLNDNLENIDALSSITVMNQLENNTNGGITIIANERLQNLDGLSNIINESLSTSILIFGPSLLTNLNGLSNFSGTVAELVISNHENLTSISGLSGITNINGNFRFSRNPLFSNLDGFENLETLGEVLTITDNDILNDYCGLNTAIQNSNFAGNYIVYENQYNPTLQNLIDGDCVE